MFDIEKLSLAGKRHLKSIMDGKKVIQELEEKTGDPMKWQEAFLLDWLDRNKDTEYGKKYHFSEIHSIEDYKRMVPITGYDDYEPYIRREADDKEEHLLCAEKMLCYAKTSGTVGVPKLIPTTVLHRQLATDQMNSAYQYALIANTLGMEWVDGRTCSLIECPAEVPRRNNGLAHCAVSTMGLLQIKGTPVLNQIFTSPEEAVYSKADTDTRYLHVRFALEDKNITSLVATMTSFMLNFFRYMEKHWELIVKDIEFGTIDESVKMDDDVRESVMKKLKPMPERAAELRAVFEQGFETPIVNKVWPKVAFTSAVGTAAFEPYYHKLKRYLGDLPHYFFGIGASEGFFTVPFELNNPNGVFVPQISFFEFLPQDAEGDLTKALTLDQVEIGKEYELVVTNLSGFYRYRMRDIVRITGMHNNTPTAQFIRRIDKTVSLTGEKTTETALRAAAYKTAAECGFDLVDFSLYPDDQSDPMGYVFYLETEHMPEGYSEEEIQKVLEKNLAEANPSMGDKVSRGICAPTRVRYLQPETYLLYQELMFAKGANRSQLKPVNVISNEFQKKFFARLSADSYVDSL